MGLGERLAIGYVRTSSLEQSTHSLKKIWNSQDKKIDVQQDKMRVKIVLFSIFYIVTRASFALVCFEANFMQYISKHKKGRKKHEIFILKCSLV